MNISRFRSTRFQTKVLLPVVTVMVLLVVTAMCVVNFRIKRQLQKQATQSLQTADAVFKRFQKIRTRNLRLRFSHVASEPKYRATCQLNDSKTLKPLLKELLGDEMGGDLIQYKPADGSEPTMVGGDATLSMEEFSRMTMASVEEALEGAPNTDTIRIKERLFDIVSVPVRSAAGDATLGVLTFCVRLGDGAAQELSDLTGSGIVLLANDQIAGASLRREDLFRQCLSLFDNARGGALRDGGSSAMEIEIPRERFQVFVGSFDSKSGDSRIGYVLLYPVEKALAELQATQRIIVAVSVLGILVGTLCVWLLVRNVTRPLRMLRDSAEAVGRGDFTQRVIISSGDECGELGRVFNRMTENLQASRHQLEETVTTLKSTQAQLIQREKMSAIGEFVAGVTHELNNPLTAVIGFSELLQQTNVDDRQRRFIDRIASSARRCKKIVQSLLSFARQRQPERKPANVNEIADSVLEIMAYEMRTSNIDIVKTLDPSLPPVLADAHQLQQVFLNIVNNARQAMEAAQRAGVLRISTAAVADRVRVIFSDNGPGVSPENLKKIFNPFFTTKEAGKGTGLGLSLSYGIIQEHGGTISAGSIPGEGATFIVELPAHHCSASDTVPVRNEATAVSAIKGQGKRVLIIDDEGAILEFIGEVLSADGYHVDTAGDGAAGLRHLRERDYDVTLCDWKMPGMNGQQLYERVRGENRPAAQRFVFMTGDVINGRIESFLNDEGRPCLAKPFSLSEFRSAVAEMACLMPAHCSMQAVA